MGFYFNRNKVNVGREVARLFFMACVSFLFVFQTPRTALSSTNCLLWYNAPASSPSFATHLPIGNSLFGAGLMGGVARDSMFLCDNAAFHYIDAWSGEQTGFGWMKVTVTGTTGYSNYRRDLDIGEAASHVSYTAGGINFKREYFCSLPDTVMVFHYTASSPGAVGLTIQVTPLSVISGTAVTATGNTITYTGYLPVATYGNWNFNAQTYVKNYNGSVSVVSGNQIQVTNADSVDLIYTSSNNMRVSRAAGFRTSDNLSTRSTNRINAALAKSYATLRANHITDFQSIFNRFTLDLNDSINKGTPTNLRVSNYTASSGNDRGLDVLWTQFCRYLLISTSRAQLPAGLQGMWEAVGTMRWGGGYYQDQNFQENYWGVQALNIQEAIMPVINLGFERQGWGKTPYTPWGGDNEFDWIMSNVYEQYRFDPDTALLHQKIWPLLKIGSQNAFGSMTATLNGKLVVAGGNAWSPEQCTDCSEATIQTDVASAWEQQNPTNILNHTLEAATVLNIEPTFRDSIRNLLAAMDHGLWISPTDGRLQEFWHDNLIGCPTNRACSHLLALWPFEDVSPLIDTTYFNAAKKAAIIRGIYPIGNCTGWGEALRVGLWARLGVGDSAYKAYSTGIANFILPNLWETCYPDEEIQLDAVGGGSAGVPEMLAQSHVANKIQLLPALPSKWPKGSVQGLRCRNGFTITSMSWDNRQLISAYIQSVRGKTCKIYGTNYTVKSADGASLIPTSTSEGCLVFNTTAGTTYMIVPGATGIHNNSIVVLAENRLEIRDNQLWFSTQKANEYTITICDLQGKTVLQRIVKGPTTMATRLNLPSGFYLVSAHAATEQIERKALLIGNSAF